LIEHQVLPADQQRQLVKEWKGEKDQTPGIYKWLQAGQHPEESFVRWAVEGVGPASGTWQDEALIDSWINFYATLQTSRGLCMVQGVAATLATQHPAKLRNAGDKAKLISANDGSGFTFRGRFLESEEAVSVGFQVTQKAHNALRWLIERQGSRNGTQAIVAWTPSAVDVPDPMASTYELFGVSTAQVSSTSVGGDIGQAFSLQLKKAIQGYRARLGPSDGIVVMGLDSATPGRMAITYYREIQGSEFLGRIEAWHARFAWPQNYGKDKKFVGAPSPRDIAQAAYGRRLDEKLEKSVGERLLPCIVDGAAIPADFVEAVRRRAANRVSFKKDEWWEWEKCLGIACALFKGKYIERKYDMALETERTSRDYLFGRLLAIAESLEAFALKQAEEQRETTAARLMQRFADRPASTWRTIELALSPYLVRLRSRAPGFLVSRRQLLDDVVASFHHDDFVLDAPLTGEFLLGYHCQRQALLKGADKSDGEQAANDD
jgi:CRISPR-associated protein Csd1